MISHRSLSLAAGSPAHPPAVCLLKAYPADLTFGFWRGREITTPGLTQAGQGMAHVKLRGAADAGPALFTGWLRQVRELALAELPADPARR